MVLSRELLENYLQIEKEIKRIDRKIEYYSNHPLASEHGVVKGSMHRFPYAECHFVVGAPNVKSADKREERVRNLVIELNKKKEEFENLQLEIDFAIEDIPDLEIKQIIQMKYIDRMTDEAIGEELGYERSSISKKLASYYAKKDVVI